jgi:peptidyl-prolyl cis-trans isomerase C
MKLDESEDFIAIIENAKRDVLAQMAMVVALKDLTVSDEEAVEFYNNHPEEFTVEPTVKARHILVPEEAQAKIALEEILQGKKTFEEAAQEYSTCPSGQVGGDLGEFGKGQMVPEFEQAAFAAELGQVVGPVVTQFGAHLIKVEAKSAATVAALEEVEEQIRQHLLQQKQHQVYTAEINELKAKYMEK